MSAPRFGTDGIRGRAGQPPLDPPTVLAIGRAIGAWAQGRGEGVLIGRDTRLSGSALEAALVAGITASGCDAVSVGVATTPAVAWATVRRGAAAGVVISASHNPWPDNGIKVFGPDGYKLADADEAAIARGAAHPPGAVTPGGWGQARSAPCEDAWLAALVSAAGARLDGMTVVVDGANGAGASAAPRAFEALGAAVHSRGVTPDGRNINEGCGALHPQALADAVVALGADLGVALDGDGDRCILVDEEGTIRDGDPIMGLWARHLDARGALPGRAVVATVMSNLGLERWLAKSGITLLRTDVGDKHVARMLRERSLTLGGEQSGHILDLSHATTGDGLLTALSVAGIMSAAGARLSELCCGFTRYPQILHNVPVRQRIPLEQLPELQGAIRDAEAALGAEGRILIRYSGTEPKARVMVEGADAAQIQALALGLGDAIAAEIGLHPGEP